MVAVLSRTAISFLIRRRERITTPAVGAYFGNAGYYLKNYFAGDSLDNNVRRKDISIVDILRDIRLLNCLYYSYYGPCFVSFPYVLRGYFNATDNFSTRYAIVTSVITSSNV